MINIFRPASTQCIPQSVLEIWSYDYDTIANLTDSEIKATINRAEIISPMTGRVLTIGLLIGGISRSANGEIVSASVLKCDYTLKKNDIFDEGTGRNVSYTTKLDCFCCT